MTGAAAALVRRQSGHSDSDSDLSSYFVSPGAVGEGGGVVAGREAVD